MRDSTLMLLCASLIVGVPLIGCNDQSAEGEHPQVSVEVVGNGTGTNSGSPAAGSPDDAIGTGYIASGVKAPPSDYADSARGERESLGVVDVTPEPDASSRNLRRMTIPQLRDAIQSATGGIYWADANGNDILLGLEPSLGVPNYIDTTAEESEPSLVFQKFLGDAARAVCTESIQNDIEMAPADRVMLQRVDHQLGWENATPAQQTLIDDNIRDMKLRITGHLSMDDPDDVRGLRWLFRSVTTATGEPAKGWRAVCVALMTSPEFYLY